MFQRKIYNANRSLFASVEVRDVSITGEDNTSVEDEDERESSDQLQQVSFEIGLSVPLEEVLYDPANARLTNDTSTQSANSSVATSTQTTVDEVTESASEEALTEETSV